MHRIAFLHSTPKAPEIAILQISSEEHEELHEDALAFVNKNKVFSKNVASVQILPHAWPATTTGTTWQLVIIHQLSCTAAVACAPL
jgi:hypothetical protein